MKLWDFEIFLKSIGLTFIVVSLYYFGRWYGDWVVRKSKGIDG